MNLMKRNKRNVYGGQVLHNQEDFLKTICKHHEQLYGPVFERHIDKCCTVFVKHMKKAILKGISICNFHVF